MSFLSPIPLYAREPFRVYMAWTIITPYYTIPHTQTHSTLQGISGTSIEHCGIIISWRVPSSAMWRRVDLVRTDVSEERVASIIKVKRISELGTLAANCQLLTLSLPCWFFHPDDGGDTFLGNVRSYKSHTASHPFAQRYRNCSGKVQEVAAGILRCGLHPKQLWTPWFLMVLKRCPDIFL
jgi:hypothetical protein